MRETVKDGKKAASTDTSTNLGNTTSNSPLLFSPADIERHRKLSISKATIENFPSEGESREFFYRESSSRAVNGLGKAKGNNTVESYCDFIQDTVCQEDGTLLYTPETVGDLPFEIVAMMVDAILQSRAKEIEEAKNT